MRLQRAGLKKARIEIIPMIDTIFFLLVFFMMESLSMVQMSSHRVRLPHSATAALKPQDKVIVSIVRDGTYYVDRQQVDFSRILPLVAARVRRAPGITVVVNCDRDVPVKRFVRAFDLVKQANAGDVMIATTPRKTEP